MRVAATLLSSSRFFMGLLAGNDSTKSFFVRFTRTPAGKNPFKHFQAFGEFLPCHKFYANRYAGKACNSKGCTCLSICRDFA